MATRTRSRTHKESKSLTQQVIGAATIGAPAPVHEFLSSRWGSRIAIIAAAAALATGVVTISWDSGTVPTLKYNPERAQQVRQGLKAEVEQLQSRAGRTNSANPQGSPLGEILPALGDEMESFGKKADEYSQQLQGVEKNANALQQRVKDFGHKVTETAEGIPGRASFPARANPR